MPTHRLASVATAASLALAALTSPAFAAPMDINLGFTSLPSAQGFTYVASGSHAGVPEGTVFSVASGVLAQNTLGEYVGGSGGGIWYERNGGVTSTETKQIRVRARCLTVEGGGTGGFVVGFATGSLQYMFTINPGQVLFLTGGGWVSAGPSDNTAFHDYLLDWSPGGTYVLYRDGAPIYSGASGYAVPYNYVFFGDGTGGANARAEIASYEFIQDLATPVQSTTWGKLKDLYR